MTLAIFRIFFGNRVQLYSNNQTLNNVRTLINVGKNLEGGFIGKNGIAFLAIFQENNVKPERCSTFDFFSNLIFWGTRSQQGETHSDNTGSRPGSGET